MAEPEPEAAAAGALRLSDTLGSLVARSESSSDYFRKISPLTPVTPPRRQIQTQIHGQSACGLAPGLDMAL